MTLLGVSGPRCIPCLLLFFSCSGRGVEKSDYPAIQGNAEVFIGEGHVVALEEDLLLDSWTLFDSLASKFTSIDQISISSFTTSPSITFFFFIVWMEWELLVDALFWVKGAMAGSQCTNGT